MNADEDTRQTRLMFMPDGSTLIPVSPDAFTVTQATPARLRQYRGAIVVDRTGRAREVVSVTRTGLHGQGLLRKIVSALTSARDLEVGFRDREMGLDELKRRIAGCLRADVDRGDPCLPVDDVEDAIRKIQAAVGVAEIFDILRVPPPHDALDVL